MNPIDGNLAMANKLEPTEEEMKAYLDAHAGCLYCTHCGAMFEEECACNENKE